MKSVFLLLFCAAALSLTACAQKPQPNPYYSRTATEKLKVKNAEWRKYLTAGQYAIGREKETERAYTGKYWDNHQAGTYYCAVCGNPLFSSDTKFESGTGWPSFYAPLKPSSVAYSTDNDLGYTRTEVLCARCGSHLGHIFDDGPKPTGQRFCMNSAVLDFSAKK